MTPQPAAPVANEGDRALALALIDAANGDDVDCQWMLPIIAAHRESAVAPELLVALRKAASVLEHSPTDAERRDMANEARAAIAKAEGRA